MKIICLKFGFVFFLVLLSITDVISQVGSSSDGTPSEQKLRESLGIISHENVSFQEKEEEIQFILGYTNDEANVEIYGMNGTLLEIVEIETFLKRLKFDEYGNAENFVFDKISEKLFKFKMIPRGKSFLTFDIDEFHIADGLNLSDSEHEQLTNIGEQLKAKLTEDLQLRDYNVISPRRSKIMLERVDIDDIRIDYDSEADRVIFGILLTVNNYIGINTYLYSSENGIRTSHEPLGTIILNRQSHELNDPEEIDAAVSEIIKGLSLNKSMPSEAESPPQLTVAPPLKTEPEVTNPAKKPKLQKVCNKVPATTLIVAGGLMGGTGIYLRIKAKSIYDNDYVPRFDDPEFDEMGARDILEDARRPNRIAHIVGAAGILTSSIGMYLWVKCAKKENNSNLGMKNIKITPHFEYNAVTNTNNVAARISFNF